MRTPAMSTQTHGLSPNSPLPTEITVHSASRVFEIAFNDGKRFRFPFEFLRVFSPSAEVRGHGPGQERLQVGKRDVTIQSVDTVGHYAVQPIFSDGHDTGLYSWDYLYELGIHQDAMWQDYLQRLAAAGASRDSAEPGAPAAKPAAPAAVPGTVELQRPRNK
jgi:DUF971 family protein